MNKFLICTCLLCLTEGLRCYVCFCSFQINGCSKSGLFKAFSEHLMNRLGIMQEKNLQVNWDKKLLLTIYTAKSCVGTQTLDAFYLQLKLLVAFQCHLWTGTRLYSWGKRQKTGSNSENIGQRSEPSGDLGRGKTALPSPDYYLACFSGRYFFFAHTDFFPPFSTNAEPGLWLDRG